MKGYRFFAEMPQDRKSKSASKANPFYPWTVKALRERLESGAFKGYLTNNAPCVLVMALQSYNNDGTVETVSAAIDGNHYSYCYGSASLDYIRQRCTRIPESLARQLSPELFTYLESSEC